MKNTNLLQNTRGEDIRRDHLVQWPDESNAAVVIDGENISPKSIGFIQSKAERLGALLLQHVLGNWSSGRLGGWERILAPHRLEPHHHGQVAAGKNATDIDLVVTVMHLYMQGIRKFCIVASDSDYTPLVEFLCDQGCLIMVIGNATTPDTLQKASSVFVEIPDPQAQAAAQFKSRSGKKDSLSQGGSASFSMQNSLESEVLLTKMSREQLKAWILEELSLYEPSPSVWVQVPQFWNYLVRYKSSFKPKAYGYKNIRILLQAFSELFQVRSYKNQENVHEVRRIEIKASH
jgi:uncharacterized LabA/DUF88 family protein